MKKVLITAYIIAFSCIFYSVAVNQIKTAEAATYRYGSTGSVVRQIQTKLKNWGYYTGAVDGVYGSKTVTAIKAFQRKNGLTPDGIAGPRTLTAIGINTGTANASYGSQNEYLLARLITGEARGETYVGQVAVGAVVLNRTRDPRFPATVAGVIYQPGAFTAVSDGQINLAPSASCVKAARDALNGWDPSGGAIYYYNPRTATSSWIRSRPVIKVIGLHVFCR